MERLRRVALLFVLLAGVVAAGPAAAEVTLPPIFSDHMVLQADAPVPIWGRAAAGERVVVTFAGQRVEAEADESGRWRVSLDPLASGVAGQMEVAGEGGTPIVIDDVLVGEVWLCAGQSNMDSYVLRLKEAQAGTIDVDAPALRLFKIEMEATPEPAGEVKGRWVRSTALNPVRLFSGIGFLFGRDLHRELDAPVGMIQASWSGSRLMAWTPREVLESEDAGAAFLERERKLGPGPSSRAEYAQLAETHQGDKKPPTLNEWPSRVYNGMVAPLMPYRIRGVLWYQGESDAWGPRPYRELFPAMIEGWRERWGQPAMPFLFVQLPGFGKPADQPPARSGWAELREAQAMALRLPATQMIVTTDIGEADIHPDNKEEVARRLLDAALAGVYGRGDAPSGPRIDHWTAEDGRVRVTFESIDGALSTRDGEPVRGFALAGDDRRWRWADAHVDGADVIVEAAAAPRPVAVRYDWADLTVGNLTDGSGLPTAPFRSDEW